MHMSSINTSYNIKSYAQTEQAAIGNIARHMETTKSKMAFTIIWEVAEGSGVPLVCYLCPLVSWHGLRNHFLHRFSLFTYLAVVMATVGAIYELAKYFIDRAKNKQENKDTC